MKKLRVLSCIFFFLAGSAGYLLAQQDTVRTLPEIEIQVLQIRKEALGSEIKQWPKESLAQIAPANLAQLLSAQTGTYIKSYGLGSLATSSIRGGSAGHTLILWNGLPIQSPMLGQLDLSLLPLAAAEHVSFQKGGNSALWGSGAIGGLISLDNQSSFEKRLNLQSQSVWGDFGRFQQQLSLTFGNQHFQSHSKFFYQKAKNNFFYTPAPGLPPKQQSNAQLFQKNLLQDLYWKINDQHQLAVHFWRQVADREIPPTLVQTRSEARQEDQSTRLLLDWKYLREKSLIQSKLGIFDEYLNYFDEQIGLESPSHFRTYLGEASWQKRWGNFGQLHLGSTQTYTQAWANAYKDIPSEWKPAVFASWKGTFNSLQLQTSLRQEWVNSSRIPLIPSLALEYRFRPFISLKAKLSKNYRLPTFNDRFWLPGGNPDLLPESGWSEEISFKFERTHKQLELSASTTIFNRSIENWILWSIQGGQRYWSANNITQVWSRGIEPRLSLAYQSQKLSINTNFGYDYILSTNQVALSMPQIAAGMQLIYTPKHQAYGIVNFQWQKLGLSYQHRYTGKTQGINDPIDAFLVGNLRLQYRPDIQDFSGTCFIRINNIWNNQYLVLERRPMPGINYEFGITITFNKHQSR